VQEKYPSAEDKLQKKDEGIFVNTAYFDCCFTLHVLKPNGAYSGQNPTKLVKTKTPAKASRISAIVPLITLVKYKRAITPATINLIVLSAEPMFFIIATPKKVVKCNYCAPNSFPKTLPTFTIMLQESPNDSN
jgi:hypothetical protein